MKSLSLTLFAAFLSSAICGQEWTIVNPPDIFFNNTIFTTVADKNGKVYAAGNFTDSSNNKAVFVLTNGVWSEVGNAGNALHANNTIYAMAMDSAGNLYAGGAFTNISGSYYSIAKWNGTQWSDMGATTEGQNPPGLFFSLASDNAGNIYAGGELIDSTGHYYIVKWDGSTWSQLGKGAHALLANSIIYSILSDKSGNIYVAGQFTNANGKYYVAKWNGTDWYETGSGPNALNANGSINSLAIDAQGNIYAAGDFKDSTGHQYVSKWDGNSWTELGSGPAALMANGMINSISFDVYGNLNVCGMFIDSTANFFVAQWSGHDWSALSGSKGVWHANNYIRSISSDQSGNIYAAGDFTDLTGNHAMIQFSGGDWYEPGAGGTKFPSQSNPMNAMGVDYNGHIFASLGNSDAAGVPIVERWDGKTWNQVPDTAANGFAAIYSLAADSSGNMYASGNFGISPGLAKWKGTGWSVLPVGADQLTINSVNHIATDKRGNVYLSGSFVQNGFLFNLAKWDGTIWHAFANADIYYFIVDSSGTIYAANRDFTNTGYNVLQITENSIKRIGGTGGQIMNANTWVQAMVLDGQDNLYIGGGFSDDNGNAYVAKWDGKSWTALGTGTGSFGATGSILALAFDKTGNLFASGRLYKNSATYAAKWNGKSWSEVSIGSMFWGQLHVDMLCRDSQGTIYANINNYIYRYGLPVQDSTCQDSVSMRLVANKTSVFDHTDVVVITASNTNAGSNTTFEFAMDPDFNQILSATSPDSVISLPVNILHDGTNVVYAKMQMSDACNNMMTTIDSIRIIKNVENGIVDIDFPNTQIQAFPNPANKYFDVSGLSDSKSYTFSLYNNMGTQVKVINVTNQTGVKIDTSVIPQGIFRVEVYDNTKNRRIGIIPIMKVR
jgi:hypothetical protein